MNHSFICFRGYTEAMNAGEEYEKLMTLVQAAADVFARWGLARSKIQDIAKAAKVAPGTVYLYARSKESLFDLALHQAMGAAPEFFDSLTLPYHSTKTQTLQWLRAEADIDRMLPAVGPGQLREIAWLDLLDQLYDFLHARRYAVRIAERSAHEWKPLAVLFFEQVREPTLARLASRLQIDHPLVAAPRCFAAARLIVGTTAWSAIHRHFQGGPHQTALESDFRELTIIGLMQVATQLGETP